MIRSKANQDHHMKCAPTPLTNVLTKYRLSTPYGGFRETA